MDLTPLVTELKAKPDIFVGVKNSYDKLAAIEFKYEPGTDPDFSNFSSLFTELRAYLNPEENPLNMSVINTRLLVVKPYFNPDEFFFI